MSLRQILRSACAEEAGRAEATSGRSSAGDTSGTTVIPPLRNVYNLLCQLGYRMSRADMPIPTARDAPLRIEHVISEGREEVDIPGYIARGGWSGIVRRYYSIKRRRRDRN